MSELLDENDRVYRRVKITDPNQWDEKANAPLLFAFGLRKLPKAEWRDKSEGKSRKYERALSVDDARQRTPGESLVCAGDKFRVVGLRVADLIAAGYQVVRDPQPAYTNAANEACPENPAHCLVSVQSGDPLYDSKGKETLCALAWEVDQESVAFVQPYAR